MHAHNIHTSSNLYSSQNESSQHQSPEAERERRAIAAMARRQSAADHSSEEAPSVSTPSQQPTTVPATVTTEPSSDLHAASGSEDHSATVARLQVDEDAAADTSPSISATPAASSNSGIADNASGHENENIPYTLAERRQDAEIEEYRDVFTMELATEDPVEFNNRIYERASIEQYLQTQGVFDFSNPNEYTSNVTSVSDPYTKMMVELDADAPRPYTEVHRRYKNTIRQEAEAYEARSERREQYEAWERQEHANSSRR